MIRAWGLGARIVSASQLFEILQWVTGRPRLRVESAGWVMEVAGLGLGVAGLRLGVAGLGLGVAGLGLIVAR